MIQTRGFTITGRVQGVGFRWWTRTHALRAGIAGAVRNRADGTVEVWLRADPDRIHAFADLLRKGPPGSKVTAVIPIDAEPEEEVGEAGFEIRRTAN